MDMNEKPILVCKQLVKKFDDRVVLKGIDMALYPGMVVGLLGQNGAGKSTLMRCALGIIQASSGSLEVLTTPVEQMTSKIKTQIGYVPQQPFGYEGFSISKALDLHRSFYPEWDRSLETEWLQRFDLDPKQQVQRLSVGQRQSLALIMSMAYRPKLLLLDEPVASLDPIARRKFMADLFTLAIESGSCVLFSSHITSDLERVASHLALIKHGELIIFKEIDEVREQVQLLKLSECATLPVELNVLNRQGCNVLVDNYQQQQFTGLISAKSLNLEQLFMELHS